MFSDKIAHVRKNREKQIAGITLKQCKLIFRRVMLVMLFKNVCWSAIK